MSGLLPTFQLLGSLLRARVSDHSGKWAAWRLLRPKGANDSKQRSTETAGQHARKLSEDGRTAAEEHKSKRFVFMLWAAVGPIGAREILYASAFLSVSDADEGGFQFFVRVFLRTERSLDRW